MSWTLQASGHAADAAAERNLAEDIGAVLANHGEAVSAAHFAGQHVSGEPRHLAAEAVKPDTKPGKKM